MTHPRFDRLSLLDAAALLWGLAGVAVIGLAHRLWQAPDDAMWTDWEEDE